MKLLTFLFLTLPFLSLSQIQGTILESDSIHPINEVEILLPNGTLIQTDSNGMFTISNYSLPLLLLIDHIDFTSQSIVLTKETTALKIYLTRNLNQLGTVVISGNRREQNILEIPISMEIIRPEMIANKGLTDLEQAVDQTPGVSALDGQVSIRGGSGFAYGAGSRVLLLWNGIPLLSGDAGDAKWNAIPMESAGQIEVMKGAASVLYGSGALNGIISLAEKTPSKKGETNVKYLSGVYDNPKRTSLKWWNKNPMFQQMDVYNGKSFNQWGYSISGYGYTNQGYRDGEKEDRARFSTSLFWTPKNIEHLKVGVGSSFHYQKMGSFLIWENDSLGYTPSGGSDTSNIASSLSYSIGSRFNIDPYLKYTDKFGNKHQLNTRFYRVNNRLLTDTSQSSLSKVYYSDYQFSRKFGKNVRLTTGATGTKSVVDAALYGIHQSVNLASYVQYEHRFFKRLNTTLGIRGEYFKQDTIKGDSDYFLGKDSIHLPFYPVVRFAAHYKLLPITHLRFSFGQGIRYPSVAERFAKTSVGSLNIFPNPYLKPEIGKSLEIGLKQVLKYKNWQGMLDVSGFITEYDNMMEFTFGFYKPDSIPISLNPDNPGYLPSWIGFMATNAEKAKVSGVEFSFNSKGKIGNFEIISLIGYTYMDPISLNQDSAYMSTFSDSGTSLLKYRFKHLAKADIEMNWKQFGFGISGRYNSFISNIDAAFEDGLTLNGFPIMDQGEQVKILPGLKEYREKHTQPTLVLDARISYTIKEKYRIGFMINNFMNVEYMTRPGDIQAPRNFQIQLNAKF